MFKGEVIGILGCILVEYLERFFGGDGFVFGFKGFVELNLEDGEGSKLGKVN